MTKYIKILTTTSLFFITSLVLPMKAIAQELSLSITPPLLELTIKPGNAYTEVFSLKNEGESNVLVSYRIVPFAPADRFGNVDLDENPESFDPYKNWFSVEKKPLNPEEIYSLPPGKILDVPLTISPPSDSFEGDHYFTLIFETDEPEGVGFTQTRSKAKIGANILLAVTESGNPDKVAEISKFSLPLITDTFLGDFNVRTIIRNSGNSFFKPAGKIIINQPFTDEEKSLDLAQQNILANSVREISCLEGEKLVQCKLDKPLFGKYKATLEFAPQGAGKMVSETKNFYALPFSLLAILPGIYLIIRRLNIPKNSKDKGQ